MLTTILVLQLIGVVFFGTAAYLFYLWQRDASETLAVVKLLLASVKGYVDVHAGSDSRKLSAVAEVQTRYEADTLANKQDMEGLTKLVQGIPEKMAAVVEAHKDAAPVEAHNVTINADQVTVIPKG